jgi:hypothetical protein
MLDVFSNVAASIWTILTMDELDEASPLSSGRLSIDPVGSFSSSVEISYETLPFSSGFLSIDSGKVLSLVGIGGFILLFILNGLVSSRIYCCFFSLFSLSSL